MQRLLLIVMEIYILKCFKLQRYLGYGEVCWILFCLLLLEEVGYFFVFSLMELLLVRVKCILFLVIFLGLYKGIVERDVCSVYSGNCFLLVYFLDMFRFAGKVLSFWFVVNFIEQQFWLGYIQNFFCLKDDLVSKG